jgi:hypothetical protein
LKDAFAHRANRKLEHDGGAIEAQNYVYCFLVPNWVVNHKIFCEAKSCSGPHLSVLIRGKVWRFVCRFQLVPITGIAELDCSLLFSAD